MKFADNVTRSEREIGGKASEGPSAGSEIKFKVSVPQPYAAGSHTLTEGEASALNQTIAENLSNNLRAKLILGRPAVKDGDTVTEPARAYTAEEAQRLVDEYLAEYEIGVRRSGSGEPRVTDPVEREARKIARQKAVDYVKSQGGKPADYDMGPITNAIFEANRDVLMAEGTKIVKALEAAKGKANDGISLDGIALAKKAPAQAAASEPAATE
jgi:hypothetical protein